MGGFYDGDDVNVKGDDGSEGGARITATTAGSKKLLDVAAEVTVVQEGIVSQLDGNKVYSIAVLVNAASSTAHNPLLLLKNPSGSGKVIYFLRAVGNTTISNERTLFSVVENPTVTANGTSATPRSRNIGGGAPSSVVLAYTLPTISSATLINSYAQAGENTNDQEFVSMQQMSLQPGNSILITGQPKSNSRVQQITIVWAEEPI